MEKRLNHSNRSDQKSSECKSDGCRHNRAAVVDYGHGTVSPGTWALIAEMHVQPEARTVHQSALQQSQECKWLSVHTMDGVRLARVSPSLTLDTPNDTPPLSMPNIPLAVSHVCYLIYSKLPFKIEFSNLSIEFHKDSC